jgi:hypothetical protein
MNGRQSLVIDYLWEENRVSARQLGGKRLSFTDDQRLRLAAKAMRLGRKRWLSWEPSSRPRRYWLGTAV